MAGPSTTWGFYGRQLELRQLTEIFNKGRWFFVKIMGRRRIGKTTLIKQALDLSGDGRNVFYVQIPDSSPPGVISAVVDAMDAFNIDPGRFKPPTNLAEFAAFISALARAGYVVVLDEFQYFNRERLSAFTSLLQAQVDALNAQAERVSGGLVVLGSIHTEMSALLEDKNAPLFSRVTHDIELTHLDIGSLLDLLRAHADGRPERLLFLWTLFEGIPKFYRDCFEQGVLAAERQPLLKRLFFESSSPLKSEADNWFLRELHGRYDAILKHIARNEGCTHGDIIEQVHRLGGGNKEQVGGYLQVLTEKYRLVEKRLPIFSSPKARAGRYYLSDNFIAAWLAALHNPVTSTQFKPVDQMVERADGLLATAEGYALEKLVAQIYEERSRKELPGFSLTRKIEGYWNSSDTEIDMVAVDDEAKRIRFISCKRSGDKAVGDVLNLMGHAERFIDIYKEYVQWSIEYAVVAPVLTQEQREAVRNLHPGTVAEDLVDLTRGLI
jgi:AAA+ ATPase superfamily predicted ATPase